MSTSLGPSLFELDAYFARVGYSGPREPTLPVLHALTAAHSTAIPFENLDVLLGRPISLAPAALMQKLVHDRRGGYCFEQNGLFLWILEALGFRVTPLSARARWQRTRDMIPPRTHLFVRVELGDESWLTDVGIGAISLTSAIRLDTEAEQSTLHEPRRIVREGTRLFHQARLGAEWADVSEFTLEEMPLIDRELGNWYTSAHPQSHFKGRLMVARAAPQGSRISLLNDELCFRRSDGQAEKKTITSREELRVVLAENFGLCFPPEIQFNLPGAAWER